MKNTPPLGAPVPSRLQTIVALLDLKSRCVHCRARLVPAGGGSIEDLRSRMTVARNGLGELIAWRRCPTCRKTSPLTLK